MPFAQVFGSRPWKRRLRVTIGLLMVAIFVLCVWLARTSNRARRQGEAIARIARLGGRVGYDYNYKVEQGNYPPWQSEDPPAPRWLLERIGPEYFRHANFVSLAEHEPPPIRAVPDLAFLDDLPDVRAIDLGATSFVDSELAHARPLKLIRFLAAGSQIGDEGLARLGAMPELWEIDLSGSRVSDAGLAHLAGMPMLRDVDLGGLKVTDSGLTVLSRLTNLERLSLARTSISDAGLARLRGLERLYFLDLRGTDLNDAALVHAKAMPGLKALFLPASGVTDEGIADLKRAMPQLSISRR